jgi:7-carboxy-7-deazaguanine synthase
MTTGFVSEIFCSNQGEGPLVGQRQVFLRTAGCSATCRWCDTRYSKVRSSHCVIHAQNGDEERTVPNPISAAAAARAVLDAARKDASAVAVSITGGEPLEQVEFVRDIAARCKAGGLDVYLETNGLQAEALAVVLPYVDVIAMDIKLPSATGTVSWKRHESFLACAVSGVATGSHGGAGAGVFVKVVVDDRSTEREIASAAGLVAAADPRIPFVLQPESKTLMSTKTTPEASHRLSRLLLSGRSAAAAVLENVRVIPQVHKILDIR